MKELMMSYKKIKTILNLFKQIEIFLEKLPEFLNNSRGGFKTISVDIKVYDQINEFYHFLSFANKIFDERVYYQQFYKRM